MKSCNMVFNKARSIMIDDIIYYDLYDLGFLFGYTRWDGKSYDSNGEKIELPHKSRIKLLAEEAEINVFYYNKIHPMVAEFDVFQLILVSSTKICRELRKEVITFLTETENFYANKQINIKGDR